MHVKLISHVWQDCAPADLVPASSPPKGSGIGLVTVTVVGLRLGSGWSGPTCKVEIEHHVVLRLPAHSRGSRHARIANEFYVLI